LNWKALSDPAIANLVSETLSANWNNCNDKSYKSLTVQYINTAKTILPDKQKASSLEPHSITEATEARSEVLKASLNNIKHHHQSRKT